MPAANVALVPPLVTSVPLCTCAPLLSVRFPPCTVSVPPFSAKVWAVLLVPPSAASELAFSTRFNWPTVDEIPALILMLLCADSVNVALPPAVLTMAFEMVMSPTSPLFPLVVTVTLTPASSAATMVATAMRDGVPVGSKLKLALASVSAIRLSVALLMMILVGSSSHNPPLPLGALASATLVTSKNRLPDVSILPPSPPSAPPRAAIRP